MIYGIPVTFSLHRVIRVTSRNSRCHEFRVQFHWIISQLRRSDGFQTLASLRKIRITLHPPETIHIGTCTAFVLILGVLRETNLDEYVHPVDFCSSVDKGEIE